MFTQLFQSKKSSSNLENLDECGICKKVCVSCKRVGCLDDENQDPEFEVDIIEPTNSEKV